MRSGDECQSYSGAGTSTRASGAGSADSFKKPQPKTKKTTAAISATISRACATSVADSEGSIMASPTKRKIGGNAGARVEEPTVDLTHEEPSEVIIDEVAKLRSVTNKLTEFLVEKAGLEKATLQKALVIAGEYQDIIVRLLMTHVKGIWLGNRYVSCC